MGLISYLGVIPTPNRNQNLIGKHFGHLTVIAKSKQRGNQGEYKWVCKCDCGNTIITTTATLNSGNARSCGHVSRENIEKFKRDPKLRQERHLKQLNNRPPITNTTGYRNISTTTTMDGDIRYRVSVVYDHKQHSKQVKTLEEALAAREELRARWWPNYKPRDHNNG